MWNRKFLVLAFLAVYYATPCSAGLFDCLTGGRDKPKTPKPSEQSKVSSGKSPFAPGAFTATTTTTTTTRNEHPFDVISKYLEKKVPSDEVSANLEAVTTWLGELKKSRNPANKQLVQVIEPMIKLQKVVREPECTDEELDALSEVEQTKNEDRDEEPAHSRADEIVYDLFSNHALKCSLIYVVRFDERAKNAKEDGKLSEPAESIIDKWIKIRQDAIDRADAEDAAENGNEDENAELATASSGKKILFNTILEFDAFPLGQSLEDQAVAIDFIKQDIPADQLKELAKEGKLALATEIAENLKVKLIKPCREFTNLYGDDLFVAAYFDYRWLITLGEIKLGGKESELFEAMARFKICMSLEDGGFKAVGQPVAEQLWLEYKE